VYLGPCDPPIPRVLLSIAQGATQGQRLEKLLAHDFSSPRGRSVAEKNAYVLLRKRKFKSAAAVFLLPRPAMLKEALQVPRQPARMGRRTGGPRVAGVDGV